MKTLLPPPLPANGSAPLPQTPPKAPNKRGISRSFLVVGAVVLIIALIAGGIIVMRPKTMPPLVTVPVTQGAFSQTVTATGTVDPQDLINVGTQVSGTISELDVDYNSKVKKGQVLARLDPTTFQAALDQAQASLGQSVAQAQASADSAAGSDAGIAAAQAAERAALAQAKAARATLAASDAAVSSARSQVAKAQSALALANQTVSRDQSLLAQGYIAQSQVDSDRSAAVAAQAALSAATIAVQQAQAQAQAQVATVDAGAAQAQQQAAQAGVAAQTARAGSATANAGADAIAIQQAQVAQARLNLDHTVITSPVDGTVIARNVSIGQTVAASFTTPTLFEIAANLGKMEIDLAVGEPDIGNVKPGDHVDFTVLAYPNRTFRGTVAQVRQNPTTVQNVVTYTVVLYVANNDGALRPGMTANATITVASLQKTLIVPLAALQWTPSQADAKFIQRRTTPATAPAGTAATSAAPHGSSSPWGRSASSGTAPIVPGGTARLWVVRDGTLHPVTVTVSMIDGASVAVELTRGTLGSGDNVVIADATAQSGAGRGASSPLMGGAPRIGTGGGAARGGSR